MPERTHGYNAYAHGCRCQVCRDARAAYSRNQRAQAAAQAAPGRAVAGAKHGTRRAYKDHGCRCDVCTAAMRAIWRGWSQARRNVSAA